MSIDQKQSIKKKKINKRLNHSFEHYIIFDCMQTWVSMFLILWTWARYMRPASSQGRSFYQRWPRPHSWPQMWRLKVSWVPTATRRTTRSTPHCCVSLSVISALFLLPLWCSYLSTLVSSFFFFSAFSVFTSPSVALLFVCLHYVRWFEFHFQWKKSAFNCSVFSSVWVSASVQFIYAIVIFLYFF